MNRTGSLFTQNTRAKCLTDEKDYNYPFACFHYIHQNPLRAGLVQRMEDWDYSSFPDYAGFRCGTLCNREAAKQYIGIDEANFIAESNSVIDEKLIEKLGNRVVARLGVVPRLP